MIQLLKPRRDSITGEVTYVRTGTSIPIEDITRLLVKEKWYFDRRYSIMKVRIIGLCPVRVEPEMMTDPVTNGANANWSSE